MKLYVGTQSEHPSLCCIVRETGTFTPAGSDTPEPVYEPEMTPYGEINTFSSVEKILELKYLKIYGEPIKLDKPLRYGLMAHYSYIDTLIPVEPLSEDEVPQYSYTADVRLMPMRNTAFTVNARLSARDLPVRNTFGIPDEASLAPILKQAAAEIASKIEEVGIERWLLQHLQVVNLGRFEELKSNSE